MIEGADTMGKPRKLYRRKAFALFNARGLVVSDDPNAIYWWVANTAEHLQQILDGDLSSPHLAELRTAKIRPIEIICSAND